MNLTGKSNHADTGFRWLAGGAALLVLLLLALIVVAMLGRTGLVLDQMGFGFLSSKRWSPPDLLFGAWPFIWGTLFTATLALVLAVPISVGFAMFVTQVAPRWLRNVLSTLLDLLAVVPSVVFGLWGVLVLATPLQKLFVSLATAVDGIPVLQSVFGASPQGRSFMTAGIVLAMMITPIITTLAREVIDTTPTPEKEGAYGLGATRWEVIRGVVWPHSKAGIISAIMLGLGRAMGETIAAALVIGSSLGQVTINAFAAGNSMPAVIANEWGEADALHKSALIGLALLLFVITIVVNLLAQFIVRRSHHAASQGRAQ